MTSPVSDALAELRRKFADQLPARMEAILACFQRIDLSSWQPSEVQALHHLLHSLTGSAGTFGMHSVSDVARILETSLARLLKRDAAPEAAEWRAIGADINRLDQLARIRLESSAPSLKPPPAPTRLDRSPLIYLVEDDSDQADLLGQALQDEGYRVRVFTSPDQFRSAYTASDTERPAAVLMDMILAGGDDAGAALIAELGISKDAGIPVVVVSVRDDLAGRLAAFRAGACRYLVKPVEAGHLIDLLDALTGRQPAEPYRVLMVDDDVLLLEAQAAVLRMAGMEVHTLSQPLLMMEALRDFTPDVAVLDVYMPDASGPELAAVLRERDAQLHLPILFLSAETDLTQQLLALNLGGDDFLTKPVQPNHLVAAVRARARRARQNNTVRQRLETTLYEREREHLALDQHAIVSIADRAGNITYANDKLCEISGYTRNELLGQNHRMLKSDEHAPEFYQSLWQTITGGKVWQGEICNRRKDGSLYWVESTITPFLYSDGKPYQYVSIRTDISHIKAAEARFAFAVEGAGDAIWDWNMLSGEMQLSGHYESMLGFDKGILAPTIDAWAKSVHPDDLARVQQDLQDYLAGKVSSYSVELRLQCKDGSYKWVLCRGTVVSRNQEGKPLRMIGIHSDISQRKQAETQLELFREMTEKTGQPMFMIDVEDKYRLSYVNRAACQHWGASKEELLTWRIPDWDPTFDDARTSAHFAETVGKPAVLIETEHILKDGRIVPVEVFVNAGIIGGKPYMFGSFYNITQRKKNEETLKLFKRIFDTSEQAIGVADGEGRMLYINPAHERMHQYRQEEVAGKHFSIFLAEEALALAPAIVEATGKGESWIGLLPQKRSDGSEFVSASHIGALRDSDGKPQYLFNILYDYTNELRRQQELRDARDKADQANQAKSEFLSSMSHELRTPMNAILGFGQLLEFDTNLSHEQTDCVQEILKGGRHLLELINDVLDLAKVESGNISLSLEAVEICPVIDECLGLVSTLAAKRDIQINRCDKEGEGVAVRADRMRLKQVLLNLLSNAIKYNRNGGSVKMELLPEGTDRLCIRVTDTGMGIPATRMAELFQPFSRLGAESSDIEGTGIGLTITRRIVELMGGAVDVTSEVGVGSTFWIELPLESASMSAQGGHMEHASVADDMTTQDMVVEQHTVLYIEDNPSNLKLVAQILGKRQHIHLLTAHTPELGIELALARRPELILLDINMPGMDGYQVLEILKAEVSLKNIPVIAVTANAMPRDIERGNAAGFSDYLTKPLDVVRFNAVIDRLLGSTKAKP